MAIAWLATGRKQIALQAANLAEDRRRGLKCPTFGTWMMTREGRAGLYDTVDGSLYRAEARENWVPDQTHPIEWAKKETVRLMVGKPATGHCSGPGREAIPPSAWRSATIIDDRSAGLVVCARDGREWRDIEVPAAPFRSGKFGAKRGRLPTGLGGYDPAGLLRYVVERADNAMKAPPDQRPPMGETVTKIADDIGVSETTVKRMLRKRRWSIDPGPRKRGRPRRD